MSDLPENLQIKRELSPPSTPEDTSPKNIKAKLHRHVKRRLQDYNQSVPENSTIVSANTQVSVTDIKLEHQKTETIRQKRPYHKRTSKNKSIQSLDNTLAASANEANIAPQRKYRHKLKQIVASDSQEVLTSNYTDDYAAASGHNSSITAGAVSAGDEDDGCHDDLKAAREKEKGPDVLCMVLSMKKRSLMQNPEVKSFLKEIMDVIKS